MFEVLNEKEFAGDTYTSYTIRNTATGEVRVLRDCMIFDIEMFDEADFASCDAI